MVLKPLSRGLKRIELGTNFGFQKLLSKRICVFIISTKKLEQREIIKKSNRLISAFLCMQKLSSDNLEILTGQNLKCETVDHPTIIQA